MTLKYWVAMGVLACVGCGSEAKYPISGNVSHNGKPLPNVNVIMVRSDGKMAQAVTDASGTFSSVTTEVPGDGAFAGKYKVGVTPVSSVKKEPTSAEDYSAGPKPTFPEKFLSTETSGIEVAVEADTKSLEIILKE